MCKIKTDIPELPELRRSPSSNEAPKSHTLRKNQYSDGIELEKKISQENDIRVLKKKITKRYYPGSWFSIIKLFLFDHFFALDFFIIFCPKATGYETNLTYCFTGCCWGTNCCCCCWRGNCCCWGTNCCCWGANCCWGTICCCDCMGANCCGLGSNSCCWGKNCCCCWGANFCCWGTICCDCIGAICCDCMGANCCDWGENCWGAIFCSRFRLCTCCSGYLTCCGAIYWVW